MRLLRLAAPSLVAVLLAVLVAACGSGASRPPASTTGGPSQRPSASATGPSVLPVIVSSELGVGVNRLVLSLLDGTGSRPVAAPDLLLGATFSGPNGAKAGPIEGKFVWAILDEVGFYTAPVEFSVAGPWQAEFEVTSADARTEIIPFKFDVLENTSVLRPGDTAPAVETPTAADVGGDLSRLSTDEDPEPSFYERSVAQARREGEPFVLAFATPKFCVTGACGPTLDRLKPVAADYPDVTFINVEPYQLELVDGQLQPVRDAAGNLQEVESVRAYGLVSEPYLFVVGADGAIVASFEAVFGEPELRTVLDTLTDSG